MQNASFIKNIGTALKGIIARPFENRYKKLGISWLAAKKLKHQAPGKMRTQTFLKGNIHFYNPWEFIYAVEEIFIEEIYNQALNNQPVILDCGAHIGLSVIYLKSKYPQAIITAFEPDEKNFQLLKTNLASQGITDVDMVQAAVWKENTELQFSNAGNMSSKIAGRHLTNTTRVKAVRLKDYLTEKIDFLKMDIEGAEFEVLNDIKEDLPKIENLFIEYHGSFAEMAALTQIFSWLTEYHFTYYIQEAAKVFPQPFNRQLRNTADYDIQLNIYAMNHSQP